MNKTLAVLALAFAYLHAQAQSALPMIIDAQANAPAAASSEQSRLQSSDASIEWIVPVKVDATLLKPGTVKANLFDQQVVITLPSEPIAATTISIWSGHAVEAGSSSSVATGPTNAQLYRGRSGALAGYISIGDAIYQLRLMDGRQVVVKRNARVLLATPDEPLFKDRFPLPPKR